MSLFYLAMSLLDLAMSLFYLAMSFLCLAMSLFYLAMSLFYLAMSLLCLAMSLLDLAMSLLDLAMSIFYLAMSLLCLAMSLLNVAMSLLNVATSLLYVSLRCAMYVYSPSSSEMSILLPCGASPFRLSPTHSPPVPPPRLQTPNGGRTNEFNLRRKARISIDGDVRRGRRCGRWSGVHLQGLLSYRHGKVKLCGVMVAGSLYDRADN
ncbi:hypothetical protein EYF80_038222 [Liparis tanakae]|uniref:Uncharacterized protein n=1 Tax=Liparis tanakae TaxID=230148 RepID=A0A4Z2GFC0_9TELE|nr:hypothetical protein EYF80_038222 [Liparis tanakae]